jgi:hypothetical protein
MFSRRELLQGVAAASILNIPEKANASAESIKQMIEELRERIIREFPDIRSIQIAFDPDNHAMPLMITAFRI